jgi:hypothetical protein
MNEEKDEEVLVEAVCWECGNRKLCREIVVCCTGTVVHICTECDQKLRDS